MDKLAHVFGDADMAEAIVRRLEADGFRTIVTRATSEADEGSIAERTREVERAHGPVDVFVHAWDNATEGTADQTSPDRWKRIVQSNVKSKFLYAQSTGKLMLERGAGNIVMLTSVAGHVAWPGAVAYSAAHGAIQQIIRTLGVEWGARGVRVNGVAGLLSGGMQSFEPIAGRIPLGRTAAFEDVAGMVGFLAGERSSYATGQIFSLDGGYSTI